MDKYNLVPRAKRAIETAIELANKNKHSIVNNAHLLVGLMECSTIQVKAVFTQFNINSENLKKALLIELANLKLEEFIKSKKDKTVSWLSIEALDSLEDSYQLSRELGHEYIGIEHILYCIIIGKNFVSSFLKSKEVPIEEVSDAIISLLNPLETEDEQVQEKQEKPLEEESKKFCAKYCHNLNELVQKNNSRIEGRDDEIDKLIEILSCKIKNNAILIGDAGVGKTAIIEGLAQRINNYNCPVFFSGFKIYSLDLGLMVAGTKYRGQFEERFKGLIEELKEDKQAILFIDEVHSIVGAGSTEGTLDLANMIKPALARGEIKCIGATTHAEYKKYFEKDSALNRRFQVISIEEPSKKQTFEILKKVKNSYEDFHGVTYNDDIINKIISLSEKYMPYRKFPDKAFDILDRIGAKGKIEKFKIPQSLKKQEDKIIQSIDSPNMETEEGKAKCEEMLKTFLSKRNNWLKKTSSVLLEINEDHILDIFSKISGLDKTSIKNNASESIVSLKEEMSTLIFDQEEALDKIYNILLCAKAGVKKTKKTLANLLFIGSTGVGKTYTAKIIAEKFFKKPNSFLQIDMAEYIEKNSVSKLIGTTAGYVGYEEGGLLSEFVRNNPFSLILFDEVEKAHPEVVNILLKIMDEGCVIDNFNRKIDFTNTIIVLTGNIGAETETAKTMGFISNASQQDRNNEYEKAVKKTFKPELISRLDETIIFNSKFSKDGLLRMISTTINEIKNSLLEKNIDLMPSVEINNFLYEMIKIDGNNARSVQKILRNKFELPLCKFIVSNENLTKINTKIIDNDIKFV